MSCAAQLVINEQYINSLKRGSVLKLTAKNRQNQDMTIDISLAGFTATYDGEAALTFDEFRKETTGENALEQVKALGYLQAPVVITDEDRWSGFRPDKISELADRLA